MNTLVYLLIHGSAKVIKYDENKISHQIAVINEGDVFGKLVSLDNAPSSASIVALIDCKVYAFSLHELKDLSHPKNDPFSAKYIKPCALQGMKSLFILLSLET